MRIVASVGRSVLMPRGAPTSFDAQRANAQRAARALTPIARQHQLVVTHAGGLPIDVLHGRDAAPPDSPDIRSDDAIGYFLEEALRRAMPDRDLAVLITCSLVDGTDPAFDVPATPVGPVHPGGVAAPAGGGPRRTVPSPEPVGVLQRRVLVTLVEAAVNVVACRRDDLPVVLDREGRPRCVEGVVDGDLAAGVLAQAVIADALLLLTDVDSVRRSFGTATATPIHRLSIDEASHMITRDAAALGPMASKLEAARRFAELDGYSVIASLDDAEPALRRAAGTQVYKPPNPRHRPHDIPLGSRPS